MVSDTLPFVSFILTINIKKLTIVLTTKESNYKFSDS